MYLDYNIDRKSTIQKKIQNDDYLRSRFRELSLSSFSRDEAIHAAPLSPIEFRLFNEFKFINDLKVLI